MKKKEHIIETESHVSLNRSNRNVISHEEMTKHLQKMKATGSLLELHFDPLGYLSVNGADLYEPDDFLLYREGTLYGSIGGTYHCAGRLDEHCRTVALVQGKKFIAERSDGAFVYSNRKIALPWFYTMLVLFKRGNTLNLLIADAAVNDHVKIITLENSNENMFLLRTCFLSLLNHHDPRMASLAHDWYGTQMSHILSH